MGMKLLCVRIGTVCLIPKSLLVSLLFFGQFERILIDQLNSNKQLNMYAFIIFFKCRHSLNAYMTYLFQFLYSYFLIWRVVIPYTN